MADQILVAVERSRLLLPPTFTRYFTWGYPDHGARIALVKEDRVRGGGKGGMGWGGGRKGEIRVGGGKEEGGRKGEIRVGRR